jgi:hypothetical protein
MTTNPAWSRGHQSVRGKSGISVAGALASFEEPQSKRDRFGKS